MGALYTRTYNQRLTTTIDGFEMPVNLPDKPKVSQMVNADLPRMQQKFSRTEIPKDIRTWDRKRERAFVAEEWHKRLHGLWILIKGEPVYLTGPAYVFFNYWHTQKGTLPTFRMEAVEFFQVWDMALRDPKCYGILDIKSRRVGDSEKILFIGWELITRYRNSNFGMQNTKEETAWKNFNRLVMSNRKMIYFFKPVPFDSDMPQGALEFKLPKEKVSRLKLAGKKEYNLYSEPELNSTIDYAATTLRQYDGTALRFYHLDEPGKIPLAVMNCLEQWEIVKLCLTEYNGELIVGKGVLSTTIEDTDKGASMEVMQTLWDQSDPTKLNENGNTTSGLWRYFRHYGLAHQPDEWGFHDFEAARRIRDNEIRDLQAKGKLDQITSLKRKKPATIHDALLPPGSDCILGSYLIDIQTAEIERRLDAGESWPTRAVHGDLYWKDGKFGAEVLWRPNPQGRWEISGHPPARNAREMRGGVWVPRNTDTFAAGADPIDSLQPQEGGSDGALAICSIFDPMREPVPMVYDEHGNIENVTDMITNRCVCTYKHRPFNPNEYYEDALKTLIYFGCKVNIEATRGGPFRIWMVEKGMIAYLAKRPATTSVKHMTARRYQSDEMGTPATEESISAYVETIKVHNEGYISTHTHLCLLKDMRMFNGEKKNRTLRDITVAWGHALTLARSVAYLSDKKSKQKGWSKNVFRTYNYN